MPGYETALAGPCLDQVVMESLYPVVGQLWQDPV